MRDRLSEGGARSHLPRGQGRETGRRAPRPLGTSRPELGGNPRGDRQVHPMCGATRCIVPAFARASARGGSPFRQLAAGSAPSPAGTRKNPQQEGARSRDRLRRGGAAAQTAAGTVRASDGRATGPPRPRARLDPPGRGRKRQISSRGDVARRCCFSARVARAILRSGQPPSASWKTAKAEGGAAKANEPRTDRKTVRRPVATLAAASPAFPEGPSDFPVRHAAGQPAARATPRVSSWCPFP